MVKYRKKSYRKKRCNRNIKKNSYKISYLNKMIKSMSLSFYYGIRESNDVHNNSGGVSITRDETTGSELPLHIYPLESIVNDNVQPVGGYKLHSNGYDFTTLGMNVEGMGVVGQNHTTMGDINTKGKNILYKNFTDIRLLLWGHQSKKTVFKIYLVKLYDEDLDPTLNPTTTDTESQEKRQILFQQKMLKRIIGNPVVREPINNSMRVKYQVKWSKTYVIDETLSTEDENKHLLVKIFRKENRNIDYQESPSINSNLGSDVVSYQTPTEPPTTYPSHSGSKNYLIITSNCSQEDRVNTYDIQIQSKYSMIGNI